MESNAQQLNNEGLQAFEKGNINLAVDLFTQALKHRPGDAEVLNNRAIAFRKMKDYRSGLEDIEKALSIEQKAVYLSTKGAIFLDLGRFQEALAVVDSAIRLEDHPEYLENKVVILRKMGKSADALEVIRLLEKKGRLTHEVLMYKAIVLFELNMLREAELIFASLVATDQQKIAAHYLKQIKARRHSN